MTEREDPPSPRLRTREAEIASTMPADLDALPRLRRFRLRGMDRVKASLTRWRPESSVAKTGLTSRVLPRVIGGNGASISGAGTSNGSDEKP